jgi:AraC-like DNA-binding protein
MAEVSGTVSILDAALRGGALALLLFLAALLLRDARRVPAGLIGSAYALGVGAYVIVSAPHLGAVQAGWLVSLKIVASGNPILLWLLAATLFDDAFKLRWYHGAAWVGLAALCLVSAVSGQPALQVASSLLALAATGLAAWHALAGRQDDLVEGRRRLRTVLVLAAALHAGVTIVSGLIVGAVPANAVLAAFNIVGLLAVTFAFAFALLSVTPDGALMTLAANEPLRAAGTVRATRRHVETDGDADAEQLAALDRLMRNERVYRREGLSIASLAGMLHLPEYRLRRLINRRLGYRNFNAFLNDHRLADVMAALADPTQAEVPILTIALDAGFQSLGPFNRAFKERTGITPTEFRRRELSGSPALAAE